MSSSKENSSANANVIRSSNRRHSGIAQTLLKRLTGESPAPVVTVTYTKPVAVSAPSCAYCREPVYLAEEVRAMNQVYHAHCFRCGGGGANRPSLSTQSSISSAADTDRDSIDRASFSSSVSSSDCCGRVLGLDSYCEHLGKPFCKQCFNKLMKSTAVDEIVSLRRKSINLRKVEKKDE